MNAEKAENQSYRLILLVALLVVAMFINYADRGSLSIAAPLLKDHLGISGASMGVLLSAFFWTYALAQPFAGDLTHRFDVRRVLAAGLALWAGATLMSGVVSTFAALFCMRLLVGLGESVIFPANSRIIACLPDRLRGRANGSISAGMALGPSLGTLAGGLILAHWGWHAVFLSLGAASLLWLVPWFALPKLDLHEPHGSRQAPAFAEIITQRALWGASVGHFCANYQYYLMLTWLPLFLVKSAHYSLTAMALIGAGIFAMQSLGSLLAGVFSDWLVMRGHTPTRVRKSFIMTGVAGCGISFLLVALGPPEWAVPCLIAHGVSQGVVSPMIFAIGQTLSGPAAGGRWMGVQNFVGNLAGIVAPIVTGRIVDLTGSFRDAFLIAGSLSVVGLVAWGLVVARVEPVSWRLGALLPAEA